MTLIMPSSVALYTRVASITSQIIQRPNIIYIHEADYVTRSLFKSLTAMYLPKVIQPQRNHTI